MQFHPIPYSVSENSVNLFRIFGDPTEFRDSVYRQNFHNHELGNAKKSLLIWELPIYESSGTCDMGYIIFEIT